jgi:transposase
MGISGVAATMPVEGSVDTEVFNVFAERLLRPVLQSGDILVLDNLGAHRASRIEQIAAECGAQVVWLSAYSPDFSPIELMWSKLKTLFRASKARSREEIERALQKALKRITEADCRAWFRHYSYEVALI